MMRVRDGFPEAILRTPVRRLGLALLLVSPLIVYIFVLFLPDSVDWHGHFRIVAQNPLHPYQTKSFFNPPWFALPLSLFGWLPRPLSQAINAYLNLSVAALVVVRNKGRGVSILLALTSFPFASLLLNGNVEWIPMTAFLLPHRWGLPLLITKPQSGIMVAVIWFKQAGNKLRFLTPLIAVATASLVIWIGWPAHSLSNIIQSSPTPLQGPSNVSPWPWFFPLGIFLLYIAWKRTDELLAVAATLCLSPYFVIHSATLFFCLLSARSPRLALPISFALWLAAVLLYAQSLLR